MDTLSQLVQIADTVRIIHEQNGVRVTADYLHHDFSGHGELSKALAKVLARVKAAEESEKRFYMRFRFSAEPKTDVVPNMPGVIGVWGPETTDDGRILGWSLIDAVSKDEAWLRLERAWPATSDVKREWCDWMYTNDIPAGLMKSKRILTESDND